MHEQAKAIITQIGHIDENNVPQNFSFDCLNKIPAFDVGDDGKILYGGWKVEELRNLTFKQN